MEERATRNAIRNKEATGFDSRHRIAIGNPHCHRPRASTRRMHRLGDRLDLTHHWCVEKLRKR